MIPRFIIRNCDNIILNLLKEVGYTCKENPIPRDVLVIGNSIVQAAPAGKNPLTVVYTITHGTDIAGIINQAILHRNWQRETMEGKFVNVTLDGLLKPITVTQLGVLIDSFVVPISNFVQLAASLKDGVLVQPLPIATHIPVQAKVKKDALTIGCADYTLADFDKIMSAYNSLLKT